jgi:hypothetical protein
MIKIKEALLPYFISKGTAIKDVDRLLLRQALKACNLKYYDHLNTIGGYICGWKLPDLRNNERDIMKMYDITQKSYMQIKQRNQGKLSSMSVHFRLYCTLRYLGLQCSRHDHNLPLLEATWKRNYDLWKQMLSLSKLPTDSLMHL